MDVFRLDCIDYLKEPATCSTLHTTQPNEPRARKLYFISSITTLLCIIDEVKQRSILEAATTSLLDSEEEQEKIKAKREAEHGEQESKIV